MHIDSELPQVVASNCHESEGVHLPATLAKVVEPGRISNWRPLEAATPQYSRARRVLLWRLLALVLIVGTFGLRLYYLASDCPLDLAPDEAHYWDWSRHLDWSYYSKGPLVAWLIRGSCNVAGGWSESLIGNQMLAVRLPALVCGSLLLCSLYILTVLVWASDRLAVAVVVAACTLPVVAVGSTLMTIDAPYACCWGWALVLGHLAILRSRPWAWTALGMVIGLGILAKYTMLLWWPSVVLFLLCSHKHRNRLLSAGFWIMTLIAAACCLPIVWWNFRHDWASLRHVGGQAGFRHGQVISWLGPLEMLGTQCALLLGFWFAAWVAAMIACRPSKQADPGMRYLWWLSAPMFLVFLIFSLTTKIQANWPVTAYLSGVVLLMGWLSRQLRYGSRTLATTLRFGLAMALGIGTLASLAMHRSDWLQPVLARWATSPTEAYPLPLRRLDPTCRLKGWRTLAKEVDELRDKLRATGVEPILAGTGWALPGEIGFYCRGYPHAYSLGLALGDRHSQYDFWLPNPLADEELFRGKTFIVVGPVSEVIRRSFARVDKTVSVEHRENGWPLARWEVTICRGFHGVPRSATPGAEPAY